MSDPSSPQVAQPTKMRLRDIAAKINEYLKKFEADPRINKPPKDVQRMRLHPYFGAQAFPNGRFVGVTFICYHGHHNLNRAEAEQYLAWLEQGGIGNLYKAGVR